MRKRSLSGSISLKVSEHLPLRDYADHSFLQGMLDRMIVAIHKYGDLAKRSKQSTWKSDAKAIKMLYQRLDLYAETGNTEWLMDVANCAMIEFMYPTHHKAHFKATTAQESPGMPE